MKIGHIQFAAVASVLSTVIVVSVGECWTEYNHGPACQFVCPEENACYPLLPGEDPITYNSNDPHTVVYTDFESDKKRAAWDAVCDVDYYTPDEYGDCTDIVNCTKNLAGWKTNAWCPQVVR